MVQRDLQDGGLVADLQYLSFTGQAVNFTDAELVTDAGTIYLTQVLEATVVDSDSICFEPISVGE